MHWGTYTCVCATTGPSASYSNSQKISALVVPRDTAVLTLIVASEFIRFTVIESGECGNYFLTIAERSSNGKTGCSVFFGENVGDNLIMNAGEDLLTLPA